MHLPYWLTESLLAYPSILLILLTGLSWAWLILPVKHWRDKAWLALTVWLAGTGITSLCLGLIGIYGGDKAEATFYFPHIILALSGINLIGLVLSIVKWKKNKPILKSTRIPLNWDEILLILLILIALVGRWLTTAYWPFTQYDPIWVYGSQARLYFLDGFIPQHIAYYPQYIQMQYLFTQLGVGMINDHVARSVIPFMHLTSILATYLLGQQIYSRRTGIIAAAIWALYPHVAAWAHVGDLEITLAAVSTVMILCFLLAWQANTSALRRQYALMSGLALGLAMWTKPTAGALIIGVLLVLGVEYIRLRFNFRKWLPKFEIGFWAGLACIPMGSLWYIRNLLLGHEVITMPPDFWLTQARRSGDYLGWLLLTLILLLIYLYLSKAKRTGWLFSLLGFGLILLGLLPSMPWINPARFDPPMSRIQPLEFILIIAGLALLAYGLWQYWKVHQSRHSQSLSITIILYILILPYLITLFYSYSYHYRLSFTIVPALIVPGAFLLSLLWPAQTVSGWHQIKRLAYAALIMLLAFPGVVGTFIDTKGNFDWFFTDKYANDDAKYRTQNPSLMLVVDRLNEAIEQGDEMPVVVAPGEQRLPFFFPKMQIIADIPVTTWAELEAEAASHFIYSSQSQEVYEIAGIAPETNQIISGLARTDIVHQILAHKEGTFHYEMYELELEKRRQALDPDNAPVGYFFEGDQVIFGDSIQFVGWSLGFDKFIPGGRIPITFAWKALTPIETDYITAIHLRKVGEEEVIHTWDRPVATQNQGLYYSSKLWDEGEIIIDARNLAADGIKDADTTADYRLYVGWYAKDSGERLPLYINGERQPDDLMEIWIPIQVLVES